MKSLYKLKETLNYYYDWLDLAKKYSHVLNNMEYNNIQDKINKQLEKIENFNKNKD